MVKQWFCEQCGQQFNSGKALGGHKKAHINKGLLMVMPMLPPQNPYENKGILVNELVVVEGEPQPLNVYFPNPLPLLAPKEYSCKDCLRTFTSFHALGGHRRAHNPAGNRRRHRQVLGFDLNMFPSTSEE